VDLKEIRRERLKQFARKHGVLEDPSGLGKLIGKEPNQVYNLLSGKASFGEKVARSIEENAGLQRRWLDEEDLRVDAGSIKLSSEVAELAAEIEKFEGPTRDNVLAACYMAIKIARNAGAPAKQRRAKNG
jgi:hypothetical protein